MPIYEYRCRDCGRRATVFFRSAAMAAKPACPHCGSQNLDKLMSRVSLRRGRASDGDPMADEAEGIGGGWEDSPASRFDPFDEEGIDDADPRQLASWTRQMSRQMGEPLDPDLDRALVDIERGADPNEALDRLDDLPPPDPQS